MGALVLRGASGVGPQSDSIIDHRALRLLRPTLAPLATTWTALPYSLFEGCSTSVWLAVFIILGEQRRPKSASGRGGPFAALRPPQGRWQLAFLARVGISVAYTLVLLAMEFRRNVSHVVAFRQMGIPLGVLPGLLALREPLNPPKIVGVLAVTVGLVLVALG